ncbi:MAG: 3-methyl-2-oxobutanoate hydroxymethyltransferase [Desulfobulbus sp.]|jgi:3-methyl-2-oxobutanoate hydroxymethyltransferase|nr:3-methyl-2-oxobutanoate hydroxymethyltransferase [Desulfobulbus sp.]
MHEKKLTIPDIKNRKNATLIAEVTAYDYPWARLADQAGMDIVLVGDSLGMVVLGYTDTVSVTMEEMIHHTKAVVRGVEHALVVTDMPFGSCSSSIPAAIDNAVRILKEGRADAVKVEGGVAMAKTVAAMVAVGIPVQGHIGLTPQTATSLGGFKVQGKSAQAAHQLIDDALALEAAGCFSIVLEAIPAPLAEHITSRLAIPTIGIGAGPDCDGQVLVIHDLVGLYDRFTPKFVKQYARINEPVGEALRQYREEVQNRTFPTAAHSFTMKAEEMDRLLKLY